MIKLRQLEKSFAARAEQTFVLRQIDLDIREGDELPVIKNYGQLPFSDHPYFQLVWDNEKPHGAYKYLHALYSGAKDVPNVVKEIVIALS